MRGLLLLAFSLTLFAQPSPREVVATFKKTYLYVDIQVSSIQFDKQNDSYVVGTCSCDFPFADIPVQHIGSLGQRNLFILKLDGKDGKVISAVSIGGNSLESVSQAAVDSQGNVIVVGFTDSSDFPTTMGAFRAKADSGSFALRWNSTSRKLDYSTYIGPKTFINSLAIDSAGAVYLAGRTVAGDIATTPGVFQPSAPTKPAGDVGAALGFVAKLDASGSRLEFASFLGGSSNDDEVSAIALTPAGDLVLTGRTNSPDFPTTPGAFLRSFEPASRTQGGIGFISSIDRRASRLLFSTYTGEAPDNLLQLDRVGNIYLFSTISDGIFQKFSPDASERLIRYAASRSVANSLSVDPDGTAYLFGVASSAISTVNPFEPCRANRDEGQQEQLLGSVVTILDAQGTVRTRSYVNLESATIPLGRDSQGRFYTVETYNSTDSLEAVAARRTIPIGATAKSVVPSCVVHGGTFLPTYVSPGALMSIFGAGIGPAQPQLPQLENGRVPVQLGGVQVTVDGEPAPLLYVSDRQINFVVPWSVPVDERKVDVCIQFGGEKSCLPTRSAAVRAGIFSLSNGQQAILNQDGSLNGPANPAAAGSTISIFLTGTGVLMPAQEDGVVSRAPLPELANPINVDLSPHCGSPFGCPVSFQRARIEYMGAAPGVVSGVTQINVTIPPSAPVGANTRLGLSFQNGLLPGLSTDIAIK